jgi:hypothetical protein
MTAPADITPLSVLQDLNKVSRDLDFMGDKLYEADRAAVQSREDYILAYNLAYLAAAGSIPQREATALVKTHTQRLAAEVADLEVRKYRQRIRILERRIDVGRSNVGVVRAETELAKAR